jgi:hypothetical protein
MAPARVNMAISHIKDNPKQTERYEMVNVNNFMQNPSMQTR